MRETVSMFHWLVGKLLMKLVPISIALTHRLMDWIDYHIQRV